MKLLIFLSVVAFGYADKLDRTYLPPPNAGTAGGSPGSLIAPGAPTSFGQGLPSSSSSSLSGSSNFGSSGFNQGKTNGPLESASDFESSGLGQPSGAGFGANIGQSATFSGQQSGFNGLSGAQNFAQDGSEGTQNKPGLGQQSNFGVSNAGDPQGNAFGSIKGSGAPSFGPVSGPSGSNAFGSSQVGFGSGQANAYSAPQPERPQAAADRNAEILKYINENNGESYNYSYETSNGISAEETGIATNGVRAQGGFAYTGDDGTRYSLTYTADENGFQPQGEHLPTPHPIPEEILKSIEENARAAAAGTQEGAYRPEEYESDNSVQQYNAGASAYSQSQGQNVNSLQGQGVNQPQSSRYPTNQDISSEDQVSGPSGLNSQIKSNQASNKFSSEANGIKGQNGQYQQGFGSNSQGLAQSSSEQNIGQNVQGVQNNGYQYSQPPNGFGSQAYQRPSAQTGPQNAQKPTSYSSGLAQVSGSNDRGIFGSNRPNDGASFQSNQFQAGFSSGSPQQGQPPSFGSNQPSFASNQPSFGSKQGQQTSFGSTQSFSGTPSVSKQGQQAIFGSNQPSFGSNQPSFGYKQEQQPSFGSSQSLSSAASISKQGQQPTFGSNQPSFGSNQPSFGDKQEQQPSFGSSESLSGAASISKQGGQQPTFGSTLPPFGSAGTSKPGYQPSFGSSQSSFGPAGISKVGEQPSFGLNQPSFGSAGNSKQGQQTAFGSSQSAFGSNQPSLASGQSSQSQQQTFGSVGSSGQGYQYGLNANQPAFNSGTEIEQGSQFGNKPSSPNVGFGQGSLQSGSSTAARPQYQQNRNQPSFESNTPNQGPQFGPNSQFGQSTVGMSTSRGSQPSIQPQYIQPGQQSAFGPSSPQSNGGLSSGASGSEFGGPRQPPSFSPQEGYKY